MAVYLAGYLGRSPAATYTVDSIGEGVPEVGPEETASTPTPTPPATPPAGFQPSSPIAAAFFYPWFPSAWTQQGIYPYSNYTPSLGYYSSTDDATIDAQLELARKAHLEAMISSWWGQGHDTNIAFQHVIARSERT